MFIQYCWVFLISAPAIDFRSDQNNEKFKIIANNFFRIYRFVQNLFQNIGLNYTLFSLFCCREDGLHIIITFSALLRSMFLKSSSLFPFLYGPNTFVNPKHLSLLYNLCFLQNNLTES